MKKHCCVEGIIAFKFKCKIIYYHYCNKSVSGFVTGTTQIRAGMTGKQPVATDHLSQRPEANALTRFVRQVFIRGRDSQKAGRDQNL